MALMQALHARAAGQVHPGFLERCIADRSVRELELSRQVELSRETGRPASAAGRAAPAPVLSLAIDGIESQYLLVGGADARIGLFDLASEAATAEDGGEGGDPAPLPPPAAPTSRVIRPLATSRRIPGTEHPSSGQATAGHLYSVTSVEWYHIDNGLFISASFDKTVKVWDTNAFQPACEFRLKERVFCATT